MRIARPRTAIFALVTTLAMTATLSLVAASPSGAATHKVSLRVTAAPTSVVLSPGAIADFHAAAVGYSSVRWQRRSPSGPWANTGSTDLTLSVTATYTLSGYQYRALFRNATSSVATPPASLSVYNTTGNWAGYKTSTGSISAASATWTVPSISCDSTPSSAWEWVGISTPGYANIEQLGTAGTCAAGSPSYFAWYETWGNPGLNNGYDVPLGAAYPLSPGDVVSASVSDANGSWTFNISDGTAWSFSAVAAVNTTGGVAEWIVEDPLTCSGPLASSCTLDTFATISPVNFTNISFLSNNQSTPLAASSYPIEMLVNSVPVAVPGPLSDSGSAFSVTDPAPPSTTTTLTDGSGLT